MKILKLQYSKHEVFQSNNVHFNYGYHHKNRQEYFKAICKRLFYTFGI